MALQPGVLVYKCRKCGKEFRPVHCPDGIDAVVAAIHGTKTNTEEIVSMLVPHNCNGHDIGIGDLIGFEEDSKKEERKGWVNT